VAALVCRISGTSAYLVGCGHPAGAHLADLILLLYALSHRANVILPLCALPHRRRVFCCLLSEMRSPASSLKRYSATNTILDVITLDVSL
jgi:hypothetical protein